MAQEQHANKVSGAEIGVVMYIGLCISATIFVAILLYDRWVYALTATEHWYEYAIEVFITLAVIFCLVQTWRAK